MKFSIITPTYKRSELLTRAVSSLISQTYTDWEMIIINDSPADTSYDSFASHINDPRIHYHVNRTNMGVNYSRNFALDRLSADSKWVIFLDDDDYLAPDALQTFHDLMLLHSDVKWFVTNRALVDGNHLTQFPTDDSLYSYAWPYLILKRLKGDATHCIETKLLTQKMIRFSRTVKQGEEWFFFYQVGLVAKMFYHSHNSTITDGYDAGAGLNFRKRPRLEQLETIVKLTYEGSSRNIISNPTFLMYVFLRGILILVR